MSIESKPRGGSNYRGSLALDGPSKGGVRMRHASVQPFNKSIYSRGNRNGLDHSKTFFKGASEYM